jgi:2-enoate reductase
VPNATYAVDALLHSQVKGDNVLLSAAYYNMLMESLDYYKVKVIKNVVVEKYENGIATIVEIAKNEPNDADRAKRIF